MTSAPDITDTEQWVIKTTPRELYGRDPEFQLADADIRLHPSDRGLTVAPSSSGGPMTVAPSRIFKGGERTYRCQFFYKPYK